MPPTKTLLSSGRLSSGAKLIVDIINVGQGNALLVSYPNGRYMLVDCGSQATSLKGSAFKHAQSYITNVTGGTDISTVVMTHGDTDHTAFIPYIAEAQAPTYVFYGGKRSWLDEDILEWVRKQEARKKDCQVFSFPSKGYTSTSPDAEFGGADSSVDTDVYVLGANYGKTKNDQSIVLMLVYGNQGVVLTGDAEQDSEAEIISKAPAFAFLGKCTFFMPAHHGSFYSTGDAFLNALGPKMAAISASGTNMSFAHPDCATVAQVEKKLLNTAEDHDVICSDGKGEPYETSETSRALAVTATNGDVRYTTDGVNYRIQVSSLDAGLRSPIVKEAARLTGHGSSERRPS